MRGGECLDGLARQHSCDGDNFAITDKNERQLISAYRLLKEMNKGKVIGYAEALLLEGLYDDGRICL